MKHTLILLALFTPGAAMACPKGDATVFSCPTDLGGSLNICQGKQAITLKHTENGKVLADISLSNAAFKWSRGLMGDKDTQTEFSFQGQQSNYSFTTHEITGEKKNNSVDIMVTEVGGKIDFVNCLPAAPAFDYKKILAPQAPPRAD